MLNDPIDDLLKDEPDNMRHWRSLYQTDPRQTRTVPRPGVGKQLTAIDPMWRTMRLTEHFGPLGIGWGFGEPRWQVVDVGEEVMIYGTVPCWYLDKETGARAEFFGVGGDTIAKKRPGQIFADDEALKKCLTDAIMNGFMRVGLSADIWLGLHQDSKYLLSVREKFDNTKALQQPKGEKQPVKP